MLIYFSDGFFLEEQSEKPSLEPDESLILSSDALPIFLVEPQDAYVVKNRPAKLQCRAAHALRLYFKCNGAKNVESAQSDIVNPQTGVRIMEAEANVTRDMVEEFFGKEKFKCECYAWSGRGSIKSQSAFVEVACEYFLFAVLEIELNVLIFNIARIRCNIICITKSVSELLNSNVSGDEVGVFFS